MKHIIPSSGYFEISKFNTKGKEIKYRLLDKLSSSMTQDNLALYYEDAKKKGNPLPLNSIQVMELLEDTTNSEDNELKNYVQKSLRGYWINTLSRVIYKPVEEKDEVIHNYRTSDSYPIIGDIVGKDNFVNKIDNQNALESLLKTKNVEKLNEISDVINQTPMYFWRLNSKPSEKIESAVRFNAGDDRLVLNAFRGLSGQCPSFLVERVE